MFVFRLPSFFLGWREPSWLVQALDPDRYLQRWICLMGT
jgi:hypothetical protein